MLKYPIALITADEGVLAGGKLDYLNSDYYLYTKEGYLTMTPSSYATGWGISRPFTIGSKILLNSSVSNLRYIRPVINISPDVLISSGDGTIDNPYQLKLN